MHSHSIKLQVDYLSLLRDLVSLLKVKRNSPDIMLAKLSLLIIKFPELPSHLLERPMHIKFVLNLLQSCSFLYLLAFILFFLQLFLINFLLQFLSLFGLFRSYLLLGCFAFVFLSIFCFFFFLFFSFLLDETLFYLDLELEVFLWVLLIGFSQVFQSESSNFSQISLILKGNLNR